MVLISMQSRTVLFFITFSVDLNTVNGKSYYEYVNPIYFFFFLLLFLFVQGWKRMYNVPNKSSIS